MEPETETSRRLDLLTAGLYAFFVLLILLVAALLIVPILTA
jgi:hypothetical protein